MRLALTIFIGWLSVAAAVKASEVQAADYGAKGDGSTLNTRAIQNAIDAAARVHGTVVFKPGVYMTGALFLKSGMQLRIDQGVILRAIQDTSQYPEMPTRAGGINMMWPAALINVYQQSDVRIFGQGVIDGNGKYWWDAYWALRAKYTPRGLRWAADYDSKRVRLLQIYQSSRVDLEGLTLERSGFWTVHLCYSHDLRVDGITIRNNIGGRGPSTDGIDVDSSSQVLIQRCDIECNDDAICMKSGRDADGLRTNRTTEYVTVRDCTVRSGAAGFTVGSDMSGGVRYVDVSGLHVLAGAPKGIFFKSAHTVEHIQIRDVHLEGVAVPVGVDLNWNPQFSYPKIPAGMNQIPDYWRVMAEPVPAEKGIPHLLDVQISDLIATGARQAFDVSGYPTDPIRNFRFDHLDIRASTAGVIADASNWTFVNAHLRIADRSHVILKNCSGITGIAQ